MRMENMTMAITKMICRYNRMFMQLILRTHHLITTAIHHIHRQGPLIVVKQLPDHLSEASLCKPCRIQLVFSDILMQSGSSISHLSIANTIADRATLHVLGSYLKSTNCVYCIHIIAQLHHTAHDSPAFTLSFHQYQVPPYTHTSHSCVSNCLVLTPLLPSDPVIATERSQRTSCEPYISPTKRRQLMFQAPKSSSHGL